MINFVILILAIYIIIGWLHAVAAVADIYSDATMRDVLRLLFLWPSEWLGGK